MKCEVFRAEVGALLSKNDPEYECYNCVYDKTHGYYDTNYGYYLTISDAKTFIRSEIPSNDYGIITSAILNLTSDEIRQIKNDYYYDDWNAWSADDIVYKIIGNNKC